ncbi:MAG TPA: Hsp70 family protein, partial [Bordetella sp.]|nr:Hsp70 family protein [Bordetella sp.]
MALLQISEPGDSPAPHQRKLAVGIDLGTTNSLVAAVRSSTPEVLRDADGQALLPSAVRYFADGKVAIGRQALAQQAADPFNTVVSVKRFMGRSLDEARASGAPYEFVEAPGMVRLRTVQGELSPVEVSAQILAVLRQRAEDVLGDDLVGAVITVPAYFDDAQRQATRDAARLAGLNVLRLLNEPTAAAIAYGLDQAAEGTYAVYDLGGGTFDVSILRLSKGVFEVVATGGDTALGGDDFDWAISEFARSTLGDAPLVPADRRTVLVAARAAREALSQESSAALRATLQDGRALDLNLTRAQFEQLVEPLVRRTLDRARSALRDAGLAVSDVKGVVMVGGATRMPVIQQAVRELFGTEPLV